MLLLFSHVVSCVIIGFLLVFSAHGLVGYLEFRDIFDLCGREKGRFNYLIMRIY